MAENTIPNLKLLIRPDVPGQEMVERYLLRVGEGSQRTLLHGLVTFTQAMKELQASRVSHGDPADSTKSLVMDGKNGWDWSQLTALQVHRVRTHLAERLAPGTVNKCLAAMRGLMRVYLAERRITPGQYQALAQVSSVSDHRRKPSRTLTPAILQQMYQACERDITAAGARDMAIMAILLAGGLRSQEVIALDRADVVLEEARFQIRSTQPQVPRWVPLSEHDCERLRPWLELRGINPGPLLGPVDKGGTIRLRRLTSTALLGMLTRRSLQVGIQPPITTRDLRRTCMVNLIAQGKTLEQVRQRVGHLSWLTTGVFEEFRNETTTLAWGVTESVDVRRPVASWDHTIDSNRSSSA